MPEGHTIHRIARDHRKWFVDQSTRLCSPQGRFEKEAAKLDGGILRDVTAHGKHLFYYWSPRKIVHVHLGLYGKFRIHKNPAPQPRGAVRMRMIGQDRSFNLNGPTCCELLNTKQHQTTPGNQGNQGSAWSGSAQCRCLSGHALVTDQSQSIGNRHVATQPIGYRGGGKRLPCRNSVPARNSSRDSGQQALAKTV